MSTNIILFGEAGVGKSSIINLLAGKEMPNGPSRRALRSRRYMFTLKGKTFNIWDIIGSGDPSLGLSDRLPGELFLLIQEIEQQGGLHLLLYCIRGGSRITQTTLYNYLLFFHVLCAKRIPIAVVVTHLENEKDMEDWWIRNEGHITRCGLEFSGHACLTGLSQHPQAARGRASLESLLLGCNLERTPLSFSFSDFLDRLLIINGITSKSGRDMMKKVMRPLLSMMDRMLDQSTRTTHTPEPSSSDSRSVSLPPRDRSRPFSWLKAALGSSFSIRDDDIVVFLIGPCGSGKSTFMRALTQADNLVDVGRTLRPSMRAVQAVRCELTDEARFTLSGNQQKYIVFVDTPSFFVYSEEEDMKAVDEMSTWLKKSKSQSTCFGTIYLHRIEFDPDADNSYRVQRQLDTFAGTFPPDLITRAFPQRLHCVFGSMGKIREEKMNCHKKNFENQISELRPRVMHGQRLAWNASIHPELFEEGNPNTAWQVVEALFS